MVPAFGRARKTARCFFAVFKTYDEQWKAHGHNESASTKAAFPESGEEHSPGAGRQSAETRRLHPRLYDNTQEAEFGYAQGCT